MNLAFFSESAVDEEALRTLIEAIIGETVQVTLPKFRGRGWKNVIAALPVVIYQLHYNPVVDGLVVVIDSDSSPLHDQSHPKPARLDTKCRICKINNRIAFARRALKPAAGRTAPLKIAVGLAVPTIESWYLCGRTLQVSEATWTRGLKGQRGVYSKRQLKEQVYGTGLVSFARQKEIAVEHMKRSASELDFFEQQFPLGFGPLRREVSRWPE